MRVSLLFLCLLLGVIRVGGAPLSVVSGGGLLNSAGGEQAGDAITHVGSLGPMGGRLSSGHVHGFSAFMHVHDSAGAGDSDGDGMSDAYDSDDDNDGVVDLHEVLAGTDVLDPADQLRITGVSARGGDVSITWDARAGRTYRIVRGDAPGTVTSKPQRQVHVRIPADAKAPEGQFVDRDAGHTGIYKIEVVP